VLEPFMLSLLACALVCAFTWIASLVTGNSSWVDRSWSIAPILYVGIFAGAAGFTNPTLTVMFWLVTLWGLRLTFNFWRKGGYQRGGEDYRWPVLKARMKPWQYQVFTVFFIILFQNVLVWSITLPAWVVYDAPRSAFGLTQLVLTLVFLALLLFETVADQQQWNFHQAKAAALKQGKIPEQAFLNTGLFRFSRHPNFFAEQSQWWVLWVFGVVVTGSVLHWSILGPLVLSALFIGSTRFTEALTAEKYPHYKEYQNRTSAIIPWIPERTDKQAAQSASS
jgi:steroid 5-alpha reductase family enzyme